MTTAAKTTTTHADRYTAQVKAARMVLQNASDMTMDMPAGKAMRTVLRHVVAVESENTRMRLALSVLADRHHIGHRGNMRDCPMPLCCEIRTAMARSFPAVSE